MAESAKVLCARTATLARLTMGDLAGRRARGEIAPLVAREQAVEEHRRPLAILPGGDDPAIQELIELFEQVIAALR